MKLSIVGFVVAIALNALVSFESTEAAICMCHPSSCVIINANNSVLNHIELHCPASTVNIHDLLILRYMDSNMTPDSFASFTNLTSLEMFQGSLSYIEPGAFEKVPRLFKLIIRNNMLSSLADYTFRGLDSLEILYLISNGLTTIAPQAFAGLKNLTHVVLSGNKIASLPESLFSTTPAVRTINLNNNMLTDLPAGIFDNINDLYRLDLSNNQMKQFDFSRLKLSILFLHNNSLTTLYLDDNVKMVQADMNRIETVTGGGGNVTDLLLHDNAISDISTIARMTKLHRLNLGNNPLRPDSEFNTLIHLRELMLSHTNIKLSERTFANLSQLSLIDLSYNNLTELDFSMFSSQIELKTLVVAFNQIAKINYIELREYLPELRVLEICGNGWNKTTLERNLDHMRHYKLRADMQGLSHTMLFSSTFVELCSSVSETSTKPASDYSDYYSEDISDIDQDISEYYPTASTSSSPATERSPSAVRTFPVTAMSMPTAGPTKGSMSAQPSVRLNTAGTMAVVEAVVPEDNPTVVGSSPLYITFQVLVYMFSVFGVVCLVVLGYYMRQRRFDVRRITPVDTADSVRLV